jgi:hypothetical protein
VLEYFGQPPLRSPELLEALIQNKATPDSTIASLAGQVDSKLMEVILINLMRLLRSPFILEALEANPGQTPDITRRLRRLDPLDPVKYDFAFHRMGLWKREAEIKSLR